MSSFSLLCLSPLFSIFTALELNFLALPPPSLSNPGMKYVVAGGCSVALPRAKWLLYKTAFLVFLLCLQSLFPSLGNKETHSCLSVPALCLSELFSVDLFWYLPHRLPVLLSGLKFYLIQPWWLAFGSFCSPVVTILSSLLGGKVGL